MWLRNVRKFFERSTRTHLRGKPVNSAREVIELVDRFIDDKMNYEMEWDDFISWTHSDPQVELIRNDIGKHESLLFSKNSRDRISF